MRRQILPLALGGVVCLAAWTAVTSADRSERSTYPLPPPAGDADFQSFPPEQVELGRLLFYDKILSGNENISCATCHHSLTDTGDGLSLSIGEGGNGLGVTRDTGTGKDAVPERVPRNAPPVFNLGAYEFTTLFHDGRLERNPARPCGFDSPAGPDLPLHLNSPLAAQAMFPVTSGTEMAGQPGENDVADRAARGDLAGPNGVWELLAERLRRNREYARRFVDAFDDVRHAGDITFVHAANAIAAFEATAWRADGSPFDRYLRGDRRAMSADAKQGLRLFYGRAGCARCHSGTFQTDHAFHAVCMPQIGPGKGDGFDGHDDYGRERVTGDSDDRFAFRTPTLRNVALTGPWGHSGAYGSLDAAARHFLDPVAALYSYDASQLALPSRPDLDEHDLVVMSDPERMAAIAERNEMDDEGSDELTDDDVERLVEFLHALTDPSSLDLRDDVPDSVPSGLPLVE